MDSAPTKSMIFHARAFLAGRERDVIEILTSAKKTTLAMRTQLARILTGVLLVAAMMDMGVMV